METKSRGFLEGTLVERKSEPLSITADGNGFSVFFSLDGGGAASMSRRSVSEKSMTFDPMRATLPFMRRGLKLMGE